MRETVFVAILLLACVALAPADVVILTDATKFPAIAVESVVLVPGKTTLLAKELQASTPVGEARPLDAARIRRIEYRAAGDTDVRPRGRAAAMSMVSGKRFESVWIESCDHAPSGGFIFQIRENFVAPGGVAFAVDSSQIASITFRPYAISGPPVSTPAVSVAPPINAGMPAAAVVPPISGPSMVPPITGPAGAAPTITTGPASLPNAAPGSAASPDSGMSAAPVVSAPAGVAVASGAAPMNAEPAESVPAAPAADAVVRAPGEITEADLKTHVTVVGQIVKIRPSWSTRAPHIVTLGKDGKTIDFVYWDDVKNALGDRMEAFDTVGTMVQVSGEVEDYRGAVQIRVVSPDSLQLAGAQPTPAPPETRWPSQIADTDTGRVFLVQGTVETITPSDKDNIPTKITVTDAQGGKIVVVFWNDPEGKTVGSHPPEAGKTWEVEGKVQVHRGELQLRARSANEAR